PADKAATVGKPGAMPVPTAAPAGGHSLVGAWYGNASNADTGETGDHVTINKTDGSFVSYFRICRRTGVGSQLTSVEPAAGAWTETSNAPSPRPSAASRSTPRTTTSNTTRCAGCRRIP
ncbi:MAG TPA: hypothetical protein VN153_10530, partial [Tahibacter sp.]|nr:hypothetical protein [Tahibacter sp.]